MSGKAATVSNKKEKNKKKKPDPPKQYLTNPRNHLMLNYRAYVMSFNEKLFYTAAAFLVGGLIGLLFYGGLFKSNCAATSMTTISNVAVFVVVGIAAVKIFLPIRTEQLLEKRRKVLRMQFRDMLESLSTSLASGSTVLDAFDDAYKDMQIQYSGNAYITAELLQISEARRNNVNIVVMLNDFAKRSGIEDIEDFANIFSIGERSGGRIGDIVRQTHSVICEKMQIENEIDSKMSANRLELNIITCAPILIVAMLKFSNQTFAENFASPVGFVAMTVGVVLFVVAYRMGQKIINIQK